LKKFFLVFLLVLLVFPLAGIRSEAAVSFKDVANNYRAFKEIAYLTEGKIAQGDSGNFYPNRDVTRAEAIALVGRAISLNGTKRATQFSDVPMSSFASGYIQSAAEKNILANLIQDGKLNPNLPITRGEMAILINAAFGYQHNVIQVAKASEGDQTVNTIAAENGTDQTGTPSAQDSTQISTNSTMAAQTNTNTFDVAVAANELKVRGIAQGITPADFGYDLKIKRADFAVFLARAINYKLRITPSITYNEAKYVAAVDFLNVRTGPATTFQKVGQLLPGTKVETAYQVGDWIYVKAENVEGLVHQEFLMAEGPVDPGTGTGDPVVTPTNPLSEQVIMIDPGHGGKDPGASGFGLKESTAVLDVALRLKALLEKTPIQFQLTRETDIYYTPAQRVEMAKKANVNMFISIHANAFNTYANGTESYYFRASRGNPNWESSQMLAGNIQDRLLEEWSLTNRGVKNGDLQVLRDNSMTAVLLELGFIDHAGDNQKLKSPEWRQKAAVAIYFGILDYYSFKGYDVANLYDYQNLK
jgi:N-acetylmuramoyl-L-alanine amidase